MTLYSWKLVAPVIGGSEAGKTNVLLNLIKYEPPDIDKVYLYVKDVLLKGEKYGLEI